MVWWNPLHALWRRGPALFGFWEGASDEQICARLSGVDAVFWGSSDAAHGECARMILRRYDSFFVVAQFGAALWVSATLVSCVTNYLVLRRAAATAPLPIDYHAHYK